jgi:beta-mannosidase
MYAHQKCANGNETIELYMERDYGVPKDFSNYVYLSQLQAGEIMKYSIEHMRRDNAYNRGVIIWQLNDCWPVVSWSGIDYYGRWKGQQYYTKRFFNPILISAFDQGENVQFFVTNDTTEEVSGVVEWKLCDRDSTMILSGTENATISSGTSKKCLNLNFHHVFEDRQKNQSYLAYRFVSNSEVVSTGTVLFVLPKDFAFQKPQFEITVADREENYEISLSTNVYVKSMALDLTDGDAIFSDNFFDLFAGEIKKITALKTDVMGVTNVEDFRSQISYHCLNDLLLR